MPSPNKYLIHLAILALMMLLLAWNCDKDTNDPVSSPYLGFEPIDAFTQNSQLGRGVNLGNALEAPMEGDWGVVLQDTYFKLIKEAGFQTVRIPIRWSAHALTVKPYTIEAWFFKRIDWAVAQALNNDLNAIVNMHHYEEIFTDPIHHKTRFLAIWKQIAEHYKDYSNKVVFEILNEPHDQLSAQLWNEYLSEALDTIRVSNPERNVVIGPVSWNSIDALNSLKLPVDDPHLIATVHYYSPFQFTHQGAGWAGESANTWLGTTWRANESQRKAVQKDFDKAAIWGEKNSRPILVGEFGAYEKADIVSRAIWTDYVARQIEARNMSWAYWEFCAGFGVYNRDQQQWNEQILNALIPIE